LRLNGGACLEVDVEGAKLDYPLGNSLGGVLVVEYIAEQEVCDHGDRVLLELVS
jgi:hypothetical protein